MANVNNPHGLRPLMRTLDGGEISLFPFTKLAAYGTAIFQWDPVIRVSGGALQVGATPGTSLFTGVVLSYSPASVLATMQVIVSPTAVYEAQDLDNASGTTAAMMGLNANLKSGTGNASRPNLSGWGIDDNTTATTNTLDVHLLNIYGAPDNAVGAYCRSEIMFNRVRMANQVVGV